MNTVIAAAAGKLRETHAAGGGIVWGPDRVEVVAQLLEAIAKLPSTIDTLQTQYLGQVLAAINKGESADSRAVMLGEQLATVALERGRRRGVAAESADPQGGKP